MSAYRNDRPQPEYPCGQADLYTVTEIGWNNYTEYLTEFEIFSTVYTAAKATDQLSALGVARSLPDEDQRDEVHKTLRVQLVPLAEACIIKWTDMSSYIRDGFPATEYDNRRMAAGYGHFESAQHNDWDQVRMLLEDGLGFATENTAELTTGGMPATYIADLTVLKEAFALKHVQFISAEERAKVLTDEKVVANNTLYQALIKMFEDGKRIFRENAAIREMFTFDRVLALVKGGSAGTGSGVPATVIEIGAYIFDEETELPKEGAQFTVLNAPGGVSISGVSGADGTLVLRVSGYEPNETVMVQVEISAEGYDTESGDAEFTAGNFYSVEVPMRRVVVPPVV